MGKMRNAYIILVENILEKSIWKTEKEMVGSLGNKDGS
jgi:hypothetical protein